MIKPNLKVGVLSIQGSFAEHLKVCQHLNIEAVKVRDIDTLAQITHLIIPGGESTTMVKLLKSYDMWSVLEDRLQDDSIKIFGTCAGAILCSYLGLNIKVNRNGFGAQQASMVVDLDSETFPQIKGAFIRAPRFHECGKNVEILASYKAEPVLVQSGNFLAASFHPELLEDFQVHKYFFEYFKD